MVCLSVCCWSASDEGRLARSEAIAAGTDRARARSPEGKTENEWISSSPPTSSSLLSLCRVRSDPAGGFRRRRPPVESVRPNVRARLLSLYSGGRSLSLSLLFSVQYNGPTTAPSASKFLAAPHSLPPSLFRPSIVYRPRRPRETYSSSTNSASLLCLAVQTTGPRSVGRSVGFLRLFCLSVPFPFLSGPCSRALHCPSPAWQAGRPTLLWFGWSADSAPVLSYLHFSSPPLQCSFLVLALLPPK